MVHPKRQDMPLCFAGSAPPVFVTATRDDPAVPVVNSLVLAEALRKLGIRHQVRIGQRGGHSYGLGNGLEAAGWFDEAIALFAEQAESCH